MYASVKTDLKFMEIQIKVTFYQLMVTHKYNICNFLSYCENLQPMENIKTGLTAYFSDFLHKIF